MVLFVTWLLSIKHDITEGVTIKHYEIQIPTSAFRDIIQTTLPDIKLDEIESKIKGTLGYQQIVYLNVYKIENNSETVREIKIHMDHFILASLKKDYYLTDKSDLIITDNNIKETSITLLPRRPNTFTLINKYSSAYSPNERFSINSKEISIQSITRGFGKGIFDDLFRLAFDYKLVALTFSIIGFFGLMAISTTLILYLFTMNNRQWLAENTSNKSIARHVALLTYIQNQTPARYKMIIQKAEKLHARWNSGS